MSGIYIPGMEMPTSCWLCHFQDCGNCVLNNHKVVDNCIMEDRRDEECPLIPVPEHGRLIDADAFNDEATKLMDEFYINGEYAEERGANMARHIAIEAPTIIPAEPPKEET